MSEQPASPQRQSQPQQPLQVEEVYDMTADLSWATALSAFWPIFEWGEDERGGNELMETDFEWLPPPQSPAAEEVEVGQLLEQALLPEGANRESPGPSRVGTALIRLEDPREGPPLTSPARGPWEQAFMSTAQERGLGSTVGTESVADLFDTVNDGGTLQNQLRGALGSAEGSQAFAQQDGNLLAHTVGHSTAPTMYYTASTIRDDGEVFHEVEDLNATARTTSVYALNDTAGSRGLGTSLQLDLDRILQLGRSPTRQRLSDDEIRSLPRVRFEAAEMQSCSICLEVYKPGELLTALACSHAFHIQCVARWLRCSMLCPNCRAPCQPVPGVGLNSDLGRTSEWRDDLTR